MVYLVERIANLAREEFGLISVGGEPILTLLSPERLKELYSVKESILKLGEDQRIWSKSRCRWERVAAEFVEFTRIEAINSDLKCVGSPMPELDVLESFFRNLAGEFPVLEINRGCPSRPGDERLREMVTVAMCDPDGISRTIHISPHLGNNDRRYSDTPKRMNGMQYIALGPDGKHFNIITGARLNKEEIGSLRDELPDYNDTELSEGSKAVYISRYILNLIRGHGSINVCPYGGDMPYLDKREQIRFYLLIESMPNHVMSGEINENDLREMRQRMMASFLINPKLFVNMVVACDMQALFPFFGEIVAKRRYYSNFSIPKNVDGFCSLITEIMGDHYDDSLSMLANVARIFGVGRFDWQDNQLY